MKIWRTGFIDTIFFDDDFSDFSQCVIMNCRTIFIESDSY